jgi:hypothetical protein
LKLSKGHFGILQLVAVQKKIGKTLVIGSDLVNSAAQWATLTGNGLKPVLVPLVSGTGTEELLAPSAYRGPARPASSQSSDADVRDHGHPLSLLSL